MIIDAFYAHSLHQLIKALSGKALEKTVGLAALPDTENNIHPVCKQIHHLLDDRDIVLQVRVNGNRGIQLVLHAHKPAKQRILVPDVPCQLQSIHQLVFPMVFFNQLPRRIPAAIVHKKKKAVRRKLSFFHQTGHQLRKLDDRIRKHFFLIITGNNDS